MINRKRKREKRWKESMKKEKIEEIYNNALKLSKNSKQWAKKLSEHGKGTFYSMLNELNDLLTPRKPGSFGINIKRNVYMKDITNFLENFMPIQREVYKVEYLINGEEYLEWVWKIESEKKLIENLLNTFENLKVVLRTMWIFSPDTWSTFKRYDYPETNPNIDFFLKDDYISIERQRSYNKINFNTYNSRSFNLNVIVGKVPQKKKRRCPFRVSYSIKLNKEKTGFMEGSLKFRFFYEVYDTGLLRGSFANEEEEDEEEWGTTRTKVDR